MYNIEQITRLGFPLYVIMCGSIEVATFNCEQIAKNRVVFLERRNLAKKLDTPQKPLQCV